MADVRAWWADCRRRKPDPDVVGRHPPAAARSPSSSASWRTAIRRRRARCSAARSRSGSSCSSCPRRVVIVSVIAAPRLHVGVRRRPAGEGLHDAGHRPARSRTSSRWTRCGCCSPACVLAAWAGRSLGQGARRVLRGGVAAAGLTRRRSRSWRRCALTGHRVRRGRRRPRSSTASATSGARRRGRCRGAPSSPSSGWRGSSCCSRCRAA